MPYIDQSFGFQTAFAQATEFIASAFVEAQAAENGVGIVKLMGRHSGFIACYAALANNDADFVLIPEVPFVLDGPDGVLRRVEDHVRRHGQVVLVVAEGAGQELLEQEEATTDASGNTRLGDIGLLPQGQDHRAPDRGRPPADGRATSTRATRSAASPRTPTTASTASASPTPPCTPAMAGRTETVVVRWRRRFVHIPMALISRAPQPGRPGRRPVDVGDRGDGPAGDVRRLTVTASQNYARLLR